MRLLSLFVSVALLSTAALAQEPQTGAGTTPQAEPGTAGSPFDALDADKDGALSMEEAQAHPVVAQNFSVADTNRDGKLSREEFDSSFTTAAPPQQSEPPSQPPPQ